MIILGIDPGYDRLGIAVLEKPAKGKEVLLYSSCFTTSKKDSIYDRFAAIANEVHSVVEKYTPDVLALETLFITKNQKTGMRVAEARGIIMIEAIRRGIPVFEYGPMQIKLAVTGDGASDKLRMTKMVRVLLAMNTPDKRGRTDKKPAIEPKLDDEYDAIAVALAHGALMHSIILPK